MFHESNNISTLGNIVPEWREFVKHCFNQAPTFERKLFTGKSDMAGMKVAKRKKAVSGHFLGLYVYAIFIAQHAIFVPTIGTYCMPKIQSYCMPAPRGRLSNIVP